MTDNLGTTTHGYAVLAIPYGQKSPMVDHAAMVIAADDEGQRFYIHEVMAVTYGIDAVLKACESYHSARHAT